MCSQAEKLPSNTHEMCRIQQNKSFVLGWVLFRSYDTNDNTEISVWRLGQPLLSESW